MQNYVEINPDLKYTVGFSLHSVSYLSISFAYLILLSAWMMHLRRNRTCWMGIPIFNAFILMIGTKLLEKLAAGIAVLIMELKPLHGYLFSNLAVFTANILLLWNIAIIYIILMMLSMGWCITKIDLANADRQLVVCKNYINTCNWGVDDVIGSSIAWRRKVISGCIDICVFVGLETVWIRSNKMFKSY
jgi:hypothetical protein